MNDDENIDYYINEESNVESNVESIENAKNSENIDTNSFMINSAEDDAFKLYTRKRLSNWEICDLFIVEWSRDRGFNIVKDHVCCENNVIRRKTYICEHGWHYNSSSNKETETKKILYKWHRLIEVLQEFTNEADEDDNELLSEDSQDDDLTSDNENSNADVSQQSQLQNPKRKRGRKRLPGTKRLKASHETNQDKGK
ncbi:11004_t:CDS:2 [Dentiscutata erythropus]|uniref:11004_t:CDS:1 n=1 Tax=Dentiscutata erythropus TaxID=1348616 RepID=A0A9N9JDL7_9GLOM|nr:11004_t:CDS:2 [Dentiscutata erythropus]